MALMGRGEGLHVWSGARPLPLLIAANGSPLGSVPLQEGNERWAASKQPCSYVQVGEVGYARHSLVGWLKAVMRGYQQQSPKEAMIVLSQAEKEWMQKVKEERHSSHLYIHINNPICYAEQVCVVGCTEYSRTACERLVSNLIPTSRKPESGKAGCVTILFVAWIAC